MSPTIRLQSPRVLFCATAGPRRGFGHLVRCGVLARALGTSWHVALRASSGSRRAARGLGWTVHGDATRQLTTWRPDLLVIDEPSVPRATRWLAAARRLGIPVASIHDLGLGRISSDVAIDGSVTTRPGRPADLQGPDYAILHADVARWRARASRRASSRVLIALGGGGHVRWTGVALARAIAARVPGVTIDLAAGFTGAPLPTDVLPPRCRWVQTPRGLAGHLAHATVAVVGGGVTLYEAAALGTPTVSLPVVPAQRRTVHGFADAGATLGVFARGTTRACDEAATSVASLFTDTARALRIARAGNALVDGHGAARVAVLLQQVIRAHAARHVTSNEVRDAA